MKKLNSAIIVLIIGLAVASAAMAFSGPGTRTPGSGNPDSWIKNLNDIYYNPAVSGNVGVGTVGPAYKLDVQGGQINTSGGLCISGDCKTAWSPNYWTLVGSGLYPNQTSYNIGVGINPPDVNYKITTSGGGIKAESTTQPAGYFSSASGYGLIVNNGNVGIGTTIPAALLDIQKNSISSTAGTEYGSFLSFNDTGAISAGNEKTYGQYLAVNRTGAVTPASQETYGQYISANGLVGTSGTVKTYGTYSVAKGNTVGSSYAYGGYFEANNADTTTALDLFSYADNGTALTQLTGINSYTWNDTPATAIMNQIGVNIDIDGSTGSASDNVYGLQVLADNNYGNITNFYGAYIGGPINYGQTVTNNYGLYIAARRYGTNKYSIYSNGGQSYFKDNVGLGITGPTYQLQLSTDSAAKPGTNTWTVASDARIKTDIRPFTDGLNTILGINPVWYKYNGLGGFTADGKDNIGVIAQDIEKIAPYTVSSYYDKLNSNDAATTELLNFNSGDLTFTTINAIKELSNKIEALGAENKALKNRIEILEAR